MLWLLVVHLDLDCMAFFLLFFPAFWHILALLGVLGVAGLLELGSTDLRIFSRAFLAGLCVASLPRFLLALLRVLGLALLAESIVTLVLQNTRMFNKLTIETLDHVSLYFLTRTLTMNTKP